MMRNNLIPALLAGLFLLSACAAPRPALQREPSAVVNRIHAETPTACAYKGRVAVTYEDAAGEGAFKALVRKSCDDTLVMKVLGLFGQVVYDITYDPVSGLAITPMSPDADPSAAGAVTTERIERVLGFMQVPLALPDASWEMTIYRRQYIFRSGRVRVVADDEFRVVSVSGPGLRVGYVYDDGRIAAMQYIGGGERVELKFFSEWERNR